MTHDPAADSGSDLKYARGVSPRTTRKSFTALEWAVMVHVGVFFLWITWGFGGGAESMRRYLGWWGSLSLLLTLWTLQDSEHRRKAETKSLLWLLPFAAFNALVVIATLNPSFQEVVVDGDVLLLNRGGTPYLPSSARPQLALHALWLFDVIYLSCFNVAFILRQRRALRGLLLLVAINALVLAIFGTVQKLGGASGIFFGAVPTRQPYFFASFIYHNHWGAFALLSVSAAIALIWYYHRRGESRDFFHSPAFGALVGLFLLAATIPLSGSRSSTLCLLLLAALAFAHALFRIVRRRRRHNESIVPPVLGAIAGLALAAAGTWFIAEDTIRMRADLTRRQVGAMVERGSIGARLELYANTWRMAQAKPWFGWGMASYPHVFTLYNTQESRVDGLKPFYRDAHNDWLQALAEHGFIGAALLAASAILPATRLRRRHLRSPVVLYLVTGCALLLLYAGMEFPFGNLAVVLTWWLVFFTAIQYARLQDREPASDGRASSSPFPR